MSMNYNGSKPTDASTAESDTLFAATPVWERAGKKRRGFGLGKTSAAAAAPVHTAASDPNFDAVPDPTFEQMEARRIRGEQITGQTTAGSDYRDASIDPGMLAAAAAAESSAGTGVPDETALASAPIYARQTRARTTTRSGAPLAVAAGVLVLGGLAAAGWYASRDDDGVAELTPGGTATSTAALDTAPMAAAPAAEMAAVTPPSTTVTRSTTTTASATPARADTRRATTTRTAAVRTRPAVASSAAETSADASATLPTAPLPYSSSTDATSPMTVNPTPATPTQVTPAPATETPSQPSTPDTSTAPTEATPPVSDVTP